VTVQRELILANEQVEPTNEIVDGKLTIINDDTTNVFTVINHILYVVIALRLVFVTEIPPDVIVDGVAVMLTLLLSIK
jgi:hypothetical protein